MTFSKLEDVQDFAEYHKQIKVQLMALHEHPPKKFVYFEKFKFEQKEAPLLLIVDGVDAKVLESVRKLAATPTQGRCRRVDTKNEDPKSTAGKVLAFEKVSGPDVKHASLQKLLKAASVSEVARLTEGPEDGEAARGKALGDKFAGENVKQGWRSGDPALKEGDKVTTRYANDKDRDASRVKVKDGLLHDASGRTLDNSLSYQKKDGFVMDPKQGDLHTFKPGHVDTHGDKTQHTHHSTPLAGAPVAGAGHIVTQHGKVKEIHDDSGHYKPSADFTLQVVEQLEALGVSLLDDSTIDKDGNPPGPEHRKKYEELKAQAEKLQKVYDEIALRLGQKFDPDKPPTELKAARDKLQAAVSELRSLGFSQKNKPATVKLQGKTGLSDEEFQKVKGNRDAINALLKTKTGRTDVVDATVTTAVLGSLEALNLAIGEALAVRLTTQQFKQTGGNEAAIRTKGDAMELIRKRGETPAHVPDATVTKHIEEQGQKAQLKAAAVQPKTVEDKVAELGGNAELVKRGIPEANISWFPSDQDKLDFLEGRMSLAVALKKSEPD